MKNPESVHVIYSVMVQGVGFRYTAERIARKLKVSGFVKNLPDGDVEVFLEGDRPALESFLAEIQKMMYGYISDSRIEWGPAQGEFSTFEIRF